MAQRDQIGRTFGAHDPRQFRSGDDGALGRLVVAHQGEGGWRTEDPPFGHGASRRYSLVSDIDNVHPACGVQMGEAAHGQMPRKRGIWPTREQGRKRLSSSSANTRSQASRQAPVEPGTQKTKVSSDRKS